MATPRCLQDSNSPTRDWTWAPRFFAVEVVSPYHWTIRDVPDHIILYYSRIFPSLKKSSPHPRYFREAQAGVTQAHRSGVGYRGAGRCPYCASIGSSRQSPQHQVVCRLSICAPPTLRCALGPLSFPWSRAPMYSTVQPASSVRDRKTPSLPLVMSS